MWRQNLICGAARIVENAGQQARAACATNRATGNQRVDFAENFSFNRDREFAPRISRVGAATDIAIHGKRQQEKKWPLENGLACFRRAVVSQTLRPGSDLRRGESSDRPIETRMEKSRCPFARNCAARLAAVLERSIFIGPTVEFRIGCGAGAMHSPLRSYGSRFWAPMNENVRVSGRRAGD